MNIRLTKLSSQPHRSLSFCQQRHSTSRWLLLRANIDSWNQTGRNTTIEYWFCCLSLAPCSTRTKPATWRCFTRSSTTNCGNESSVIHWLWPPLPRARSKSHFFECLQIVQTKMLVRWPCQQIKHLSSWTNIELHLECFNYDGGGDIYCASFVSIVVDLGSLKKQASSLKNFWSW